MPKETIETTDGQVAVGWTRERDVQVGVVPLEGKKPDPTDVGLWLTELLIEEKPELRSVLRGIKLTGVGEKAIESFVSPDPGAFATLGRDDINRLIRSLRKARDAAYGQDA